MNFQVRQTETQFNNGSSEGITEQVMLGFIEIIKGLLVLQCSGGLMKNLRFIMINDENSNTNVNKI